MQILALLLGLTYAGIFGSIVFLLDSRLRFSLANYGFFSLGSLGGWILFAFLFHYLGRTQCHIAEIWLFGVAGGWLTVKLAQGLGALLLQFLRYRKEELIEEVDVRISPGEEAAWKAAWEITCREVVR